MSTGSVSTSSWNSRCNTFGWESTGLREARWELWCAGFWKSWDLWETGNALVNMV